MTTAAEPFTPLTEPPYVAALTPVANIAVGDETPWGVAAELFRLLPGTETGSFEGQEAGPAALAAAGTRRIVAVVRDEHRHPWMATALDVLLAARPALRADVVTEWNSAALNAIRLDKTPPPKASRALAILHAAIYDAVNGITRTHEPYLIGGYVPASASVEAAAAAAAHRVLVSLYSAQQATFDATYQTGLASLADGPQKNAGVAWGEYQDYYFGRWDGKDDTRGAPGASVPLPAVVAVLAE